MQKAASAYQTISEVSEALDIPAHVLRFWEGKFNKLRPLKRSGGRRYYRPDDIELLRRIKKLLYVDGFTIRGAQKLIRSKPSNDETVVMRDVLASDTQTLFVAIELLDDVKIRLGALKQKLDTKLVSHGK